MPLEYLPSAVDEVRRAIRIRNAHDSNHYAIEVEDVRIEVRKRIQVVLQYVAKPIAEVGTPFRAPSEEAAVVVYAEQ